MVQLRAASWLAAVAACGLSFGLWATDEPPVATETAERVGADDIVVIIAGEAISGFPIFPATETEFKLKLSLTGNVVAFRWSTLEESERRRVQKEYGLTFAEDGMRKMIGEKMEGVEYTLTSGKKVRGLRLPDRDRPGIRALKTATAPLISVYESEIKSEEVFAGCEGDFFSAREIYDRMMMENPPGINDASAHLDMARKCANMELYDKALDHLDSAAHIDPKTVERNQEFRVQLVAEHANKQVKDLMDRMQMRARAGEYFAALADLETLDRNFPNHPSKSRWDSMRTDIKIGSETELKKNVILMTYTLVHDLLLQRLAKKIKLDAKGNVVASVPGKQVTTRQGDVFRGTLVNPDSTGDLTIRMGNTELTIAGKDVMSVQDVDLSKGVREVSPSWDELKAYVTDTGSDSGLKGQLVARIVEVTRAKKEKIREIIDDRLKRTATYDAGKLTMSPLYASYHDASYGKGSWLREGVRPMPIEQRNTGQRSYGVRNNSRGQSTYAFNPQEDEHPDLTDDPNVWWRYQATETQLGVLRALAAEKLFVVESVQEQNCPGCGAKGVIATQGSDQMQRCPTCRGIGKLFKIVYK